MESYLYPVKEGQRYINLNPGRLSFSSHLKREEDQEAHLYYYASVYIGGDNYHTKKQTKPNTTKQACVLN